MRDRFSSRRNAVAGLHEEKCHANDRDAGADDLEPGDALMEQQPGRSENEDGRKRDGGRSCLSPWIKIFVIHTFQSEFPNQHILYILHLSKQNGRNGCTAK